MIQDIEPSVFNNAYVHPSPAKEDVLFYFEGSGSGRRTALNLSGLGIQCPSACEAGSQGRELQYLFSVNDIRYFLAMDEKGCPQGFSMEKPSAFRCCQPKELCFAGMTACHLYDWYSSNRFCGRCGSALEHAKNERALCCPSCGNVLYPRISPVVIMGITHKDRILMSRYANREYKGRALLAGFCEIGETAEQTVAREAMEEVGLHVKNIRYFASQPWGFDGGLLLGFFAEADGSLDIAMDTSELAKAEWVKRGDIEPEDNLLSLTATMIEAFRTAAC